MPTVDAVRLSPARRRAVGLFRDGACVRTPNEDRREKESHCVYKKGYEIRFYTRSRAGAAEVERVLTAAGLRAGRPYRKHENTWITPMYGRDQVTLFLGWVERTDRR